MINKVALFYNVEPAGLEKLRAELIQIGSQIHRQLPAQANPRVRVMSLVEGAVDGTPHVVAQGYRPTALRAGIEFGNEEASLADLIEMARRFLPPAAERADAASSCALAGREYVFCPGEQPYTLRVFMGRSLTMTYEDFHSHWLNRHGWIVKPRVDLRKGAYRQFHADPKASLFAARAAGVGRHEFEGCAEG
jgi:hypothetical protein